MPSKSSQPRVPRPPNSRRKPNPTSKPKSHATPSYFVLDTIFPSHIVNDRSLFTSYTPSNRIYRTAFGTDITIEGTGNVEVCVQAGGKSIIFTVHDCWHIPSSPHHFLSCLTVTSPTPNGRHQIMLAGRTPRILFPHKDRLITPNLPKYVPIAREQGYFVLKFKVPMKTPLPPEPAPANTKSSSLKFPSISLYALLCQPFAGLMLTRPSSLDEIGDEVIPLKDKGTFFTESDADHVSIGITGTFSPPPSFSGSPTSPLSLPPLPLPQHSSSSSSLFPPILISPQQFSSDTTVAVHVHDNSMCYASTDSNSAPYGGVDAPAGMDIPITLNQVGDVGIDVGSHGRVYVSSSSALEHHHYHQQQCQQQPYRFPSADSRQHQRFTTPPPALLPQLQHHHHPQNLPSPHVPPPPGLPLPPHHPAPPTVVYPSMMTQPSWIPYPISPYIPQFSPFNHGYQPIQQPGVTIAVGGYQHKC